MRARWLQAATHRKFLCSCPRGTGATGVNMSIRSAENQPPQGADIQKGFESIGIPALCSADIDDQTLAEDTVMIYAGAKQ